MSYPVPVTGLVLMSQQKHMLSPLLEPPPQDGSNEGSQLTFSWGNIENYPKIIPVTPFYLEH